jgi:hypothetical protein
VVANWIISAGDNALRYWSISQKWGGEMLGWHYFTMDLIISAFVRWQLYLETRLECMSTVAHRVRLNSTLVMENQAAAELWSSVSAFQFLQGHFSQQV